MRNDIQDNVPVGDSYHGRVAFLQLNFPFPAHHPHDAGHRPS